MKNILIPMADGNEDIELISIIDILRRARKQGAQINIICASISTAREVQLDSGLVVLADTTLDAVDTHSLDAIVLAGGFGGMMAFKSNAQIISIIKSLHAKGALVAAICASPMVLDAAGVLDGGEFACYPGCEVGCNGTRAHKPVVVNRNVITSAGPITASYFALSIVRELGFVDAYNAVSDGLLIKDFGIEF